MFSEKIAHQKTGVLVYGITPPKNTLSMEGLLSLGEKRNERISRLECDALITYDVQDESARNREQRPFEYLPTLDPMEYIRTCHDSIGTEKILYHVVGKYSSSELLSRINTANTRGYHTVLVGAASNNEPTRTKLSDAYSIWNRSDSKALLGGIMIPERHATKSDEHLRIVRKQGRGCDFFVSQCVCNLELAKNVISDYAYYTSDNGIPRKYFIFTLTTCGSPETLELMNWLGIDIPRWMKNDLLHAKDVLQESVRQNLTIAKELYEFCKEVNISCGFNIESVSPRRQEIEASVELFTELKNLKYQ